MSGRSPGDAGPNVPGSGLAAPAPVPVDVGVVAAMSIEVGFLLDRLTKVRKYAGPRHSVIEGECGGKLVALIVAGMGRAAARSATQLLIDGHRPRALISAGFAGALDPGIQLYDVLLADEVLDLEGRRAPVDLAQRAREGASRSRPGRLLTVDQIIRTAAEKAELRARFQADAVDMESSAVGEVCRQCLVPWLSIRVVSDDAHSDLPREVATLMTRSGSYRVGAALRALWDRPASIKDFWKLHAHAQEAADRLAQFTAAVIERLG